MQNHTHGFIKDCLQTFLSKGTALHIPTIWIVLLDQFASSLFLYGGSLCVCVYLCVFSSLINFVAYKYFRYFLV
mgnify:CR=1 FL=1